MSTGRATDERLTRWRLVLGEAAEAALPSLVGEDQNLDRVLGELYEAQRGGGLGNSAPSVARWLGDIRSYFPSSVVRVMQRDALDWLGLKQLLLEPELLAACTEVQRRRPVTILHVKVPGTELQGASLVGLHLIQVPYQTDWESLDRLQLAA